MINDALRLLRTFSEMKQAELAIKLGVNKSWVSEIEAGKKKPTLALLEQYSTVFEIPLSSIVFFSEELTSGKTSEKARAFLSKRIIAILDYVAANAEDDDEAELTDLPSQEVAPLQDGEP